MVNEIEMAQGADQTISLIVFQTDGVSRLDITSHGITFTVKDDTGETVFRIQKSVGSGITITDAVQGEADIILVPADTTSMAADKYVYDVWVEPPAGQDFQAIPVSEFKVLPRVTIL